jgi:UDP-glucuronate 4-epimerase
VPTILLTGAAGFIGAQTARVLRADGYTVIGVDNFSSYYDPQLKHDRVKALLSGTPVINLDIADTKAVEKFFSDHRIDQVCHLAAQPGVRYSLENPFAYDRANNLGTLNLLEACRRFNVMSFVFASSSSVYGGNKKIPFVETDAVDHPISVYAATKA